MVGFIRWPTLDEWGQQLIWRSTASEPHSPLLTGQQLRHKSCVSGFWWRAPTALQADCSWKINGITWRLHCLPTNTAQNSLLLLPVSTFVIVFLDVQYCISWHLYILLTIAFFHVISFLFFWPAQSVIQHACWNQRERVVLRKSLHFDSISEDDLLERKTVLHTIDLICDETLLKPDMGGMGRNLQCMKSQKEKEKIQPFFIVHYKCQ